MKSYFAVLARELGQRKAMWWAALVAGLLPFLIAAAPGMTYGYAAVRDAAAFTLAAALGTLLAFILGAAMIGRDLSEGRLGFDFAKPIGGFSIWAGRLSAAVILVWGVSLITLLPSTIAGGGLFKLVKIDKPWYVFGWSANHDFSAFFTLVVFALFLLGCVALAHVLGVMVRARTPWLFLDLAGLILVTFSTFLSARHLWTIGTWGVLPALYIALIILAVLLLIGLLAAGAAQVCVGRTDPRKGHGALSITLWSILLVSAFSFAGYARWYTSFSISDIEAVGHGYAAPEGDWVYLSASMRHRAEFYNPGFLFNAASGTYLPIGNINYWSSVVFSRNGQRCAWFKGRDTHEIMTVKLDADEPVVTDTNIGLSGVCFRLALSPSGKRCALLSNGQLVVYELDTGKLLASVRIYGKTPLGKLDYNNYRNTWTKFRNENHVSIIQAKLTDNNVETSNGLTFRTFYIGAGSLEKTGEVAIPDGQVYIKNNFSGDRFVLGLRTNGSWSMSLRDAATGELLASLPEGVKAATSAFLREGGVAAGGRIDGKAELHVYSRNGEELRTIDFGPKRIVIPTGEPETGKLFVRISPSGKGRHQKGELYLVNLESGHFRKIAADLAPLSWYWWYGLNVSLPTGASARLFIARDGSLVRVNPDTGARKVLIRGHLKVKN